MAEFSGSALVMQWIHSGGTVTLSGAQRTVNYSPSAELYDNTAGSDPAMTRLVGKSDFTVAMSALLQTGGTVTEDALVAGKTGTLIIGPEGTASGKRKYTLPAISNGAQMSYPYNNVVEFTCDWSGNGAGTLGSY